MRQKRTRSKMKKEEKRNLPETFDTQNFIDIIFILYSCVFLIVVLT